MTEFGFLLSGSRGVAVLASLAQDGNRKKLAVLAAAIYLRATYVRRC